MLVRAPIRLVRAPKRSIAAGIRSLSCAGPRTSSSSSSCGRMSEVPRNSTGAHVGGRIVHEQKTRQGAGCAQLAG
eukprot:1708144-Alexandrium_andersonii.AAC.1